MNILLQTSIKIGPYHLPNRIVMAPLTRMRAPAEKSWKRSDSEVKIFLATRQRTAACVFTKRQRSENAGFSDRRVELIARMMFIPLVGYKREKQDVRGRWNINSSRNFCRLLGLDAQNKLSQKQRLPADDSSTHLRENLSARSFISFHDKGILLPYDFMLQVIYEAKAL